MSSPKIVFVTGTDTDCGKTTTSLAILKACREKQRQTIALKPIASGANPHNPDALSLRDAATIALPLEQVNSYCFQRPIAPHIAAQNEDVTVSVERLVEQVAFAASLKPDLILIEGAGGWMVPLGDGLHFADVVRAVGAEVLLVVGMTLGYINHTLLTHRAIMSDGVKCMGWYANIFDNNMPALEQNISTIEHALGMPSIIIEDFFND